MITYCECVHFWVYFESKKRRMLCIISDCRLTCVVEHCFLNAMCLVAISKSDHLWSWDDARLKPMISSALPQADYDTIKKRLFGVWGIVLVHCDHGGILSSDINFHYVIIKLIEFSQQSSTFLPSLPNWPAIAVKKMITHRYTDTVLTWIYLLYDSYLCCVLISTAFE